MTRSSYTFFPRRIFLVVSGGAGARLAAVAEGVCSRGLVPDSIDSRERYLPMGVQVFMPGRADWPATGFSTCAGLVTGSSVSVDFLRGHAEREECLRDRGRLDGRLRFLQSGAPREGDPSVHFFEA
jgi:hypothetical protein